MAALQSLNDIAEGECAVVSRLLTHGAMRRRFLDIGLTEGAEVECVGASPMGDPRAYLICGAVVAIRKADARSVLIEKVNFACKAGF